MRNKVRASIQSIAGGARMDDFSDTESLLDFGVLDSLAIMQLVPLLEEQFQVRIAVEDLLPENFDSVARIAAFLATKTAATNVT